MRKIEFGLRLPVAGPLSGPDAIDQAATAAIEHGWDTLWVHDFIVWSRFLDLHHVSCGSREAVEAADGPPYFHESLTNLAYLAGLTRGTQVRLGVAVLCLPYRNPVVTGRQLANIDVLSRGRLTLGIGLGAPKDRNNRDFEVLGIPRTDKYERSAETMRVMDAMWADGITEFQGDYVSFEPTEFYPKPAARPPVWIGGSSEAAMKLVLEFGNGWFHGGTAAEYAAKNQQLRDFATAAGRPDFQVTGVTERSICVANTAEEAEERATKTLNAKTIGYPKTYEQLRETALLGTADDVIEQCLEYVAAGVDHFELKPIYHDLDQLAEMIRVIGQEVAPAVRERAG